MTTVGIVTGAGRGMGKACARRLAGTVDTLLLIDVNKDSAHEAAAELPAGTAEAFPLDITDRDGLDRLAARVAELGTLRSVAHVAGISPTMADWRRIVTVDLVATALLGEVLRPLSGPGTATVCFASMAPRLGPEPSADVLAELDAPLADGFLDRLRAAAGDAIEAPGIAYSTAKLGVTRYVRREAVRLGPSGARVCSLSPGLIDTPQGRQEAEGHAGIAELLRRTPLDRMGRSEEIAAVVAFLLSDEASFVNGIDLLVDGGVCAAVVDPPGASGTSGA
ncbi:SDR family oxidoreductase [Yinghuangia sp. ASG 101]|uniref:SDR family oxidoreductase n=1 Tax=Yinghuangia sp. ASG 101 TaxID=2896848 RepID=UPI001E2B246A|nr:SDR family oxidoreductase [Yinghuangia sp. ASG 101]UGQ13382.1 SDR family oxidoreductase [Yinghuangia sp. ASG 101]